MALSGFGAVVVMPHDGRATARRALVAGLVMSMFALTLSGCLIDRPVVGNLSLQREGDDVRVAFCEPFAIDVLWIDQRVGKRQQVWEARPSLRVAAGEIVDRLALGGSLQQLSDFAFDSASSIIVQASGGNSSVEAEFPIGDGVPTDRWLHPDGSVTNAACGGIG